MDYYMEWLNKMGPGILTALISVLFGYWLHKIKAHDEIRQRHFEEIKQKVLNPILKLINNYYIPVLQLEINPLYVKSMEIDQEMPVLKPSVSGWQYEIAISEPSIFEEDKGLIYKMYRIPSPPYFDRHLFTDLKANHCPELVGQIEKIQQDFDEYTNEFLNYANELKSEISSKSELPGLQDSVPPQDKWINANKLTIFILERQLGINRYAHIRIDSERDYFRLVIESTTLAQGTKTEMEHCVNLIENLVGQSNKSQEHITMANALLEKVVQLKADLERLNLTHKLSGKCIYCKI